MAAVVKNCSVSQAFNFQKDSQETVGHVTKLTIGTQALTPSLEVVDPTDFTKKVKVVGVLSSIAWEGGITEPLAFSCQIGTVNKNIVALLAHKDLSNTEVKVAFNVYDYDPQTKTFYKSLHTNDVEMMALVHKTGGQLHIAVSEQASSEVPNPLNYSMSLGAMPASTASDPNVVHIAVSSTDKLAKQWGLKQG
jgi:hypothetical protein